MEKHGPRVSSDPASGSPAEPSEADIRSQLNRVLTSPEFSVPERLRHFLSYVVEQTLSGQADRIKAYSVAVEVFGRDVKFDIQNDPVVRIEAGRLRRALERYYLLAGSEDRVTIEIPKGGYVPRFAWRSGHREPGEEVCPPDPAAEVISAARAGGGAARPWITVSVVAATMCSIAALLWIALSTPAPGPSEQTRPDGPSLIVKPFLALSDGAGAAVYAAGLSEEILAQLARFKELTVFGRETSDLLPSAASAADIRKRFGSRYLLEGSVRLSGGARLRVSARLLDGETGAILWSQLYDADLSTGELADVEVDIASKVATAVAQPYGIVFSARPASRSSPGRFGAYQCALSFYRYRTVLGQPEHAATRECLEQITLRYPAHATGWAMLSYLYLDEDRFRLNRRPGNPSPLERAREAAMRAVQLDPQNVRALQAQMTVLFFSHQAAEALRIGAQALALNPNDTELLGEFGSRVAQAGDWPRGVALLEEAMAKNPGHSGYYVGILALAAHMQGDDARAVELIRRADMARFSIYHFVAALIYARAGLEQAAAKSRDQFLKLRPDFFDDFDAELGKRNFIARDRAILIEGARRAGFPVKASLASGTD